MALSLYTSASAMSSTNALTKANTSLSTAMQRLGTGKRINTAADDAAGLQIATRLQAQSNGMAVAKRNIADATALLQTAEGAFEEITNILYRMKDIATQAANGTNTDKDKDALKGEYDELAKELDNIVKNTKFGGEDIFGATMLGASMTFQIGASASETMVLNVSADLTTLKTSLTTGASALNVKTLPTAAITALEGYIDGVGAMRAKFGASINRLEHSGNNVANMKDNTDVAIGTIRDADYASEVTNMSRNSMLAQTSMAMLKQSNSMQSMVMSLLS